MAKLVIDSAYLESYKAFLKEGIEMALHIEPGVLTIYALSEKENPTHFTILETYANAKAYQTHIQTPHYMVKSLELIEIVPLLPRLKVTQIRNSNKKSKR